MISCHTCISLAPPTFYIYQLLGLFLSLDFPTPTMALDSFPRITVWSRSLCKLLLPCDSNPAHVARHHKNDLQFSNAKYGEVCLSFFRMLRGKQSYFWHQGAFRTKSYMEKVCRIKFGQISQRMCLCARTQVFTSASMCVLFGCKDGGGSSFWTLSWMFSSCSHSVSYSGSWPCLHLQMQPCTVFPVSREQNQVCVCVRDRLCGRASGLGGGVREEVWKRGRRRYQRRWETRSPRSDKGSCGVQRQRKRDPPRDHERHACLPCLAPFSFSLLQHPQAAEPTQQDTTSTGTLFQKNVVSQFIFIVHFRRICCVSDECHEVHLLNYCTSVQVVFFYISPDFHFLLL